jgi:DNA-binding XRE family transcriptional regulator
MDLNSWMARHNVVDQTIAEAIGVTRPYINRVRNGGVHPSLGVALAIWDYTKREIDIEQLLPKHSRPKLTPPAVSTPANPRGRPRKLPVPRVSKSPVAA